MTVESRLLISHLIMFIVPIFMTVIVAAVMPAGAPTLSRGNNYLYLENISKCTRAAEISCHNFFHGNLEHPEISRRPAADFPPVPKAESYSLHQRKKSHLHLRKQKLSAAGCGNGWIFPSSSSVPEEMTLTKSEVSDSAPTITSKNHFPPRYWPPA